MKVLKITFKNGITKVLKLYETSIGHYVNLSDKNGIKRMYIGIFTKNGWSAIIHPNIECYNTLEV